MSYSHASASALAPATSASTQSLMYLSSQLNLLSQRNEHLAHLTQVTAEQASYMRLLGGTHAALFMAAQKVFIPQDDEIDPQQVATDEPNSVFAIVVRGIQLLPLHRAMTALLLPPELLLLVFKSLSPGPSARTDFRAHRAFVDTLLSSSLVHRSWTATARSLLVEHVWIRGDGVIDGRDTVALVVHRLRSEAFASTPVKAFTVSAFTLPILKSPYVHNWSRVVRVCLSGFGKAEYNLDEINLLPALCQLRLEDGLLRCGDRSLVWPRLEELVVIRTFFINPFPFAATFFTPTRMPSLSTLAISVGGNDATGLFGVVFENVLVQIQVLALFGGAYEVTSLGSFVEALPMMKKLSILSMHCGLHATVDFFLHVPANVKVDALHFGLDFSWRGIESERLTRMHGRVWSTVAKIGKGEQGTTVRADRVFLYGSADTITERVPGCGLESMTWVEGRPPFCD